MIKWRRQEVDCHEQRSNSVTTTIYKFHLGSTAAKAVGAYCDEENHQYGDLTYITSNSPEIQSNIFVDMSVNDILDNFSDNEKLIDTIIYDQNNDYCISKETKTGDRMIKVPFSYLPSDQCYLAHNIVLANMRVCFGDSFKLDDRVHNIAVERSSDKDCSKMNISTNGYCWISGSPSDGNNYHRYVDAYRDNDEGRHNLRDFYDNTPSKFRRMPSVPMDNSNVFQAQVGG